GLFFAFLFDRARVELKTLLPGWLDIWFELEALGSLANFADLNPEYVFPEVMAAPSDKSSVFYARELGHPLIPDEQRVCNNVEIGALGQMLLITGSNMSGKSSLLRTVGVNLCLAYSGAPVLARALRVPLFRLFTCIKISDSVTDGVSYFYAEVKRLKALLDALTQSTDGLPLFFLIDEIFRGTNNRERLTGSRAYIRALVGHNGIGIVSTHDLELVKLADEISHIHNYHFQETVVEGRMIFDYKLQPGPSPTTNALKIMRLAGLPVDED
ncbi:MAG: MutS family DNA mismatch repair protein, partial [Aggregatilineales bacterium]